MANAAAQAKLIKSTLIFLIYRYSQIKELLAQFEKNAVMTMNILPPGRSSGRPLNQENTKLQVSLRLIR
jgi:hypothetical protein